MYIKMTLHHTQTSSCRKNVALSMKLRHHEN
jgi:hypothetical protein